MGHSFNPAIIREYDIRGTVGKNLNVEDALALGKAFGSTLIRRGGKVVAVGLDGRTHSPMLEKSLIEGLTSVGIEVRRIGLCPTPMLYFAAHHLNTDGGIMVTGSHNPADQNGFKMLFGRHIENGGSIYGDAIIKLAECAFNEDFILDAEKGGAADIDVSEDYIQRIVKDLDCTNAKAKKLNVVWDCGNGAAGAVMQRIADKLPGKHTILFAEVDGTFPNHHPDPTVPKNLEHLRNAVKETQADLGIAFDGDADRIGAIDSEGKIAAGDQLLTIYAHEVLAAHKGAVIIGDVKSSQVLFDKVKEWGGKPYMSRTGHSLIKAKMLETGAPLGGEMSGHMFFADKYYGYDDGLYAGIRLLSLIVNSGKSLKDWLNFLPKMINTPEIRIDVDETRKFDIIEEVKKRLAAKNAQMNLTDGVRVQGDEGWWLLRASNTQNVLVARVEADTETGLQNLMQQLTEELKLSGIDLAGI
ncbi:MAG: phosphomannomutase/phosphoglucomutase [Alphaproteobacteria bacterium]|nr:phosphomannomutase/phosphoglucomutase [Alphaproteobacteria bacterium]MCL2506003.1 phosphomannomutase/phosphoglucomutase [Alphaproteobacteria bacterium]